MAHVENEEDAQKTPLARGGVEGNWLEHPNLLDGAWRHVQTFMELFSVALESSALDLLIGGFIY